ncbi:MAG: hypothetical protein ACJAYJ_001726 [Saprospiraceae bacterium]|jgi:hypothetical protein
MVKYMNCPIILGDNFDEKDAQRLGFEHLFLFLKKL